MSDFFPGIDLRWDDDGISGWIKRNAADLIHWCTILAVVAFVAWSAAAVAVKMLAQAPETAQQAAQQAASKQPPWWWDAALDVVKAITPLALPFLTNYARKIFKEDE